MKSTHDVAITAVQHHVRLREKYIDLHGYDCFLRRALDTRREDFFGDIKSNLVLDQPVPLKLVMNITGVLRKVHHVPWGSDDWTIDPIKAEARLDDLLAEGDMVIFDLNHLRAVQIKPSLASKELKYFQIAKISQGMHYVPVSNVVSLVPFRDQIPGVTI